MRSVKLTVELYRDVTVPIFVTAFNFSVEMIFRVMLLIFGRNDLSCSMTERLPSFLRLTGNA